MRRKAHPSGKTPTEGKRAVKYMVSLEGEALYKQSYTDHGPMCTATARRPREAQGRPEVVLWPNDEEPAWEGDYGRLIAVRVR